MSEIYEIFSSGLSHEGVGIEKTREELIFLRKGEIKDWKPLVYELESGGYTDYQNENKTMRLCSSKLRDVLEAHKSEHDIFQWLDATVMFGGESRMYYILHFPEPSGLLNPDKCIYARNTGRLVVPRLSNKKCEPHNIFNLAERNISFYVRDNVKKAIEEAKCTGMIFEKIKLMD